MAHITQFIRAESFPKTFAAYDWKNNLSDEEILEKLLALNLERSAALGK